MLAHLHVTCRTSVQQAVAVVYATERSRRGHRPSAGAMFQATDSATEKSSRLSAGVAHPAIHSRRITDTGIVMIGPRQRCGPRLSGAVQAHCVRGALKIATQVSVRQKKKHVKRQCENLPEDLRLP